MKLTVNLENLKCIEDTRGPGKDEVYVVCMVNNTNVSDQNSKTYIDVTKVEEKVKPGDNRHVKFQQSGNEIWEVELEGNIEDNQISTTLLLFEKDNGKIYEQLKNGVIENEVNKKFEWDKMATCLKAITSKNPVEIITCVFAVTKTIINLILPDDKIDQYTLVKEDILTNNDRTREIPLNGWGAKYEARTTITLTE